MATVALNPVGGVSPAPDVLVLKAGEYAALVESEILVEETRRQLAEVIAAGKKAAEQARLQAFEEGKEEGKAEVAGQLFEAVSASVEQMASMESALVDVVIRAIRTILGSFDQAELAEKAVSHALRLVRDEKRVVLRVSPADADVVQARLADILKRYPGMARVDVAADASLSSGGCVMETEIGVIDATLERQLAIIEETFRRHLEERKR